MPGLGEEPQGLAAAVASGDRRLALLALRDHLASALEDSRSAMAVAPIAKQLTEVMRELDEMPVPGEVSHVDELAERAARRRAEAAAS